MATLSGNKIKDTYQSLVKFSDNGNITTSAKQLTDGFGNNSPMYVSTTQVGIGVTPESGLNLHVYGDAKIGSNLTVIGNLVVEGSTTTVGTDTLTVKDPLIVLANNNTSTDAVDIGFYGKYTPSGTTLYSGLFREALTGKYRLFKDLQVEPTTTVNTSGTGYSVATLVASLEGDVTGNITGNVTGNLTGNVTGNVTGDLTGDVTGDLTGNVTGGTISGTTGTFSGNVDIDGTLDVDDVISVEGSAFGRIEIGGASGGYVDLKAPNSDDYDLRLSSSVGGGELLSIDTLKFYTGATTDLAFTIDASQNATFENNVTIPETPTADTHAASKGYVDAAVEGQDTLAEILANGNTTGGTDISVSSGDDITFADNSKIIFGDSGDIEMFFDGGTFVIDDTSEVQQGIDIDTNRVRFRGTDLYLELGNAQHTFWTTGTQRLQINSSGVNVSSDFTVNTDTLFVDYSADSVGIGLTNPADYTADELVISVPDGSGMTLVSGTTDAAYIAFQSSTGAIATNGGFIGYDHDADGLTMFAQSKVSVAIQEAEVAYFTDTAFYVDKSTTIDDNLIVNGNVGIGETSPDKLLHLKSSGATGIAIESTTNSQSLDIDFYNNVGSAQGRIRYEEGAGAFNISPNVSSPNAMYINYSNNVGIGTTDPEQKLHVEGASITVNRGNDDSSIAFQNSTSGATWRIGRDYSNSEALTFAYSATDYPSLTGNGLIYINTSGNVGIGVTPSTIWSSSYNALQIGLGGSIYAHSSAGNALKLGSNIVYEGTAPNYYDKYLSSSTATKYEQDSGSHIWSTASSGTAGNAVSWTESMRIDSSGTTSIIKTSAGSSTTPLVVRNSGSTSVGTEAKIFLSTVANDDRGAYISSIITDASNGNALILATNTAGSVPTERMRIDSSGNAIFTKSGGAYLQLKDASAVRGAINVETSDGLVFTTGSSFTERMRIDGSGNVGIGTDSPSGKLHVGTSSSNAYSSTITKGSNMKGIINTLSSNVNDMVGIYFATGATTEGQHWSGITGSRTDYSSHWGTQLNFYTHNNDVANLNDATQKMVIKGDGNVGIGTTSPSNKLEVAGDVAIDTSSNCRFRFYQGGTFKAGIQAVDTGGQMIGSSAANDLAIRSESNMLFSTGGNTERMRITSGGDVLIGTTSKANTDAYFEGASNDRMVLNLGSSTTADSTILVFRNNNGGVGSVRTNGSSTSYITSSDYRLKENVVELTGALDRVSQLKPSRFNFIADADKTVDGFLAHEVQEIVPEAITGEKDGMRTEEYEVSPAVYEDVVHPAEEAVYETVEHPAVEEELDDEGNVVVKAVEAYTEEVLVTEAKEEWTEKVLVSEKVMGTREVPDYQGIDQSKLVPLLVGAIQEQQQLINDLKNRIETLENN